MFITIYALKLNNGFIFQNKPEIVTSGKYQDKVQFEIDYQNCFIFLKLLYKLYNVFYGYCYEIYYNKKPLFNIYKER